jgi:hypothetical protein
MREEVRRRLREATELLTALNAKEQAFQSHPAFIAPTEVGTHG